MLSISLWFKVVSLFFVIVSFAYGTEEADLTATYCDGSGWVPYLDEKCFKLIKRWATRDDAKNACAQELLPTDPSIPQLVSIKTPEEQDYLTKYVFDESAVKIGVWLGAKRSLLSPNTFVWDDESEIDFSNWAQGSPTEKAEADCVEMQSEISRQFANSIKETHFRDQVNGKWRDVTCELPNYVLCEKLQRWSFGKMQQSFISTRKEMKDSFDSVVKELDDTKNKLSNTQSQLSSTQSQLSSTQSQLSSTQSQLSSTQSQLSSTQSQLSIVQNNPVPIGFLYVQLPNQPEPRTLWSNVQWTDVTAVYAGLFFRAEGGGSEQFGNVQSENAPRVTVVKHIGPYGPADGPNWQNTTLNVGGWSSGIGVFTGSWVNNQAYLHRFYTSGGEIRPRNMAMRFWKRIG